MPHEHGLQAVYEVEQHESIFLERRTEIRANPMPTEVRISILDQFGHTTEVYSTRPLPLRELPQPDVPFQREVQVLPGRRIKAEMYGIAPGTELTFHLRCQQLPAGMEYPQHYRMTEDKFDISELKDPSRKDTDNDTPEAHPDRDPDLREVTDHAEPARLENPLHFEDEVDRWWYENRV